MDEQSVLPRAGNRREIEGVLANLYISPVVAEGADSEKNATNPEMQGAVVPDEESAVDV